MSDNEAKVKKIPYGISDYEKIVTGGYYYVDKTPYLKTVEEAGDYLFFIRPRRFGKSLFISMMEGYYDVYYKDRSQELFRDTAVFRQPTAERNAYLVLSFNFSMVDPAPDKVEASFLSYVKGRAESFILKYGSYLLEEKDSYVRTITESRSAADILGALIRLCKDSGQKTYAIIDEYDNFANTILSTTGEDAYLELTRGKGFFRSFFNILKGGTGGMEAPFARLFLTGVSPITLDDVTSGYNIGKNVSTDSRFNQMLGFTEADVTEMIGYYRGKDLIKHDDAYLLPIMRQWYNNYIFSRNEQTPLFNSDMVLYFLDRYFQSFTVPADLIDRNVRIDYGKLRHLIIVDKKGKAETNGNFSRLRQIIEDGEVASKIIEGFPLEEIEAQENFTSLLFYFGLLSIMGEKEGLPLLKIPNQTVRTLFYDYIIRISRDIDLLDANTGKLDTLLHGMAYRGEWQAFFEYFSQRLKASTSIRDFFREEKVVQGFLLAYLGISDYFIVHSEKELNKGYADIVMEPFLARYEGIKFSYLVEIKYFPKPEGKDRKALENKIRQLREDAETQLKQYAGDEKFDKTIGKTTLVKLVLVFSGSELAYIGPCD